MSVHQAESEKAHCEYWVESVVRAHSGSVTTNPGQLLRLLA